MLNIGLMERLNHGVGAEGAGTLKYGLSRSPSAPTVQALRQSGLLKFFCTSPMRGNVCLLEFLIGY